MSTSSRGNAAERFIAHWLEDRGWLVGSRRHIGGAGDLLAVRGSEVWLIEAKERKSVYVGFTKDKRAEMVEAKKLYLPDHAELWCCNKQGKELIWIPEMAWP